MNQIRLCLSLLGILLFTACAEQGISELNSNQRSSHFVQLVKADHPDAMNRFFADPDSEQFAFAPAIRSIAFADEQGVLRRFDKLELGSDLKIINYVTNEKVSDLEEYRARLVGELFLPADLAIYTKISSRSPYQPLKGADLFLNVPELANAFRLVGARYYIDSGEIDFGLVDAKQEFDVRAFAGRVGEKALIRNVGRKSYLRQDRVDIAPLAGTVKWFNRDKGFGFIEPDNGGADVFVHKDILQNSEFEQLLIQGQKVEFVTDKEGLFAPKVSLLLE